MNGTDGSDASEGAFGVAAAVVGVTVAAATYVRIFFGVDFTDESFYIAVPLRIWAGARPFVDETQVTDTTTALVIAPLLGLYKAFFGVAGIVLFVRHVYLVVVALVGAVVFDCARRRGASRSVSFLLALVPVATIPFNIPSLSYNTVASALLTVGFFIYPLPSERRSSTTRACIAGFCHGTAAVAYPPLVVVVAGLIAVSVLRNRPGIRAYAAAAAVPVVSMAFILLLWVGVAPIIHDYRNSTRFSGQGGGLEKVRSVLSGEMDVYRLAAVVLVPYLGLLLWARTRRPGLVRQLLPLLPLLCFLAAPGHYWAASLDVVGLLSLAGAALYPFVARTAYGREMFGYVWLPSIFAGCVTAYSSANGQINFGVGAFSAAMVPLLLLPIAITPSANHTTTGEIDAAPALAAITGVLTLLVVLQWTSVYRDAGIAKLGSTGTGAYAGLRTTDGKVAFLQQLRSDIEPTPGSMKGIMFYDNFPAGYILSELPSRTNTAWTFQFVGRKRVRYRQLLLRYYASHAPPGEVVEMHQIPQGSSALKEIHDAEDPLATFVRRRYKKIVQRRDYIVFAQP